MKPLNRSEKEFLGQKKPSKLLTQRQEKFCHAIVEGMNQSDAYREAYDVSRSTPKSVNENASQLMRNVKILSRVRELQEPAVKAVQYDYARWLEEIQRMAFFDVRKLFDAAGNPIPISDLPADVVPAIAGLEVDDSSTLKYKLSNKLKALELFGKATGYYQDKVAPPMNPLETASTEVLLEMLAEVKARQAARQVAQGSHS